MLRLVLAWCEVLFSAMLLMLKTLVRKLKRSVFSVFQTISGKHFFSGVHLDQVFYGRKIQRQN